jgi:hypothetical protein
MTPTVDLPKRVEQLEKHLRDVTCEQAKLLRLLEHLQNDLRFCIQKVETIRSKLNVHEGLLQ